MKKMLAGCWFLFALSLLTTAWAQGSLLPPGPPSETMKSLDQVEARIPITKTSYTCDVAGASYYLTSDLTAGAGQNGIEVTAANVTVDLNGFALYGSGATAGTGIRGLPDAHNLRVLNGTVYNWGGIGYGIFCDGRNVEVASVRVGDSGAGIMLSDYARVSDCVAANNSGGGIVVRHNGQVENCMALSNGWHGIYAWNGASVRNCMSAQNSSSGIELQNNGHIKDNTVVGNGTGLRVTGTGSYVADNTVNGNAANYDFAQGNQLNLLISEVPVTVSWPAYILLAGTLTSTGTAIYIDAPGVTVDLGGHSLLGPDRAGGSGVLTSSGKHGCTIRNGAILNFNSGVDLYRTKGSRVEGVSAVSNINGICFLASEGCMAEASRCEGNEGSGFVFGDSDGCVVRHCVSVGNALRGFDFDTYSIGGKGNVIEQCEVSGNATEGIIFRAYSGDWLNNTIRDCSIVDNGGTGILFRATGSSGYCNGNSILRCNISQNAGAGICFATTNGYHYGNVIEGCTLTDNSDTGIAMYRTRRSRVDGNHIATSVARPASVYAIFSDSVSCQENLIVRNSAAGYTTEYNLSANDTYGPMVTTVGALGTSGGDAHPWANFAR
ncbi:MAG TPA: hypothetical protein DCZ95_10330 [Verrucomicrobia bacterium]|nr:MAG: hypothetical protein A2X46_18815 [Lentisphaerae bacterium GWF2_57_35]HBA84479.1 hypothetical protein [Verrucomicrobiota bacterium]